MRHFVHLCGTTQNSKPIFNLFKNNVQCFLIYFQKVGFPLWICNSRKKLNFCSEQCCGSESICFWALRIQIRYYVNGSGSFHQQAKKVKKHRFLLFYDFFMTFLSLRLMELFIKKAISKKGLFFCWHLVGHWRKKQVPDPDPYQKVTDPQDAPFKWVLKNMNLVLCRCQGIKLVWCNPGSCMIR